MKKGALFQYNLRPPARTIVQAIEAKLQRLPEDETLYVLMGEDHANSVHAALLQMVMEKMDSASIPCALGVELPENDLQKDEPAGTRLLTSYLRQEHVTYEPGVQARKNLFTHCLKRGIHTRFNDAARLHDDGRYVVRENGQPLMSPDGMKVRNIVMARSAVMHAQQAGARVYFMSMGTYHVVGGRGTNEYAQPQFNVYSESVLANIINLGKTALAVIPTSPHFYKDHLPWQAGPLQQDNRLLLIDGLPQRQFFHGYNDSREESCLKTIARSSHGEFTFYMTGEASPAP